MYMKNIYIGGDSFCVFREDPKHHWPKILANLVKANMTGEGHPGYSWWPTRMSLLKYMESPAYKFTDVFVFCHTQSYRIIAHNDSYKSGAWEPGHESHEDFKVYMQTFFVEEFQYWCYKNYILELNKLLKGKKVIHLPCFTSDLHLFDECDGILAKEPLTKFTPWSDEYRLKNPYSKEYQLFDSYHNHMSKRKNHWLAEKLAYVISNYDEIYKNYTEKNSRFSLVYNK